MANSSLRPLLPPSVSRVLGWGLLYCLLVAGIFTFPNDPTTGLDPSWRMALGYFYEHGMQFGRDVVFTYGPLGFIMAKTFSGVQFWSLIAGQLVLAVISATVIMSEGARMQGVKRVVYFLFFFLFAMLYEDALHMLVIVILGFGLIRLIDQPQRAKIALIAAVLAGYSQIKFTDFLLAGFIVLVTVGYGLWRKQGKAVAVLAVSFAIVYLGIWVGCGQSLANLPAYFHGSWEISQGYQWAMGFPAPMAALWKGVVVLCILAAYAILPLCLSPDKPRAWANSLLLGAYVYLNWKHGFVRADGHMIGFFFCAMLPLIAYPVLLNDPDLFRFAHRWVFVLTLGLCVWGVESALNSTVRLSFGWMQDRIWSNVSRVVDWGQTRQRYRDLLSVARAGADLSHTRNLIGNSTVDVLGGEQSVVIFNKFNYQPRPVIQSYSTFTPALAQLNADFIKSDAAPEFFLTRIETIDRRLLTLDDAQLLQLLPYRYEFIHEEKGFQLWKRPPGPFDAEKYAPKFIRSETADVNRPLSLGDLQGKPVWARINLETSWLGKIRAFLYQPPHVQLNIADAGGSNRDYLMPLPQGRNGFILAPIVGDTVDYMHYASALPRRWASAITIKVEGADAKYFAPTATVEFSALPPLSSSGEKYFPKDVDTLFSMFRTPPISFGSQTGFSTAQIDGRTVAIMHAPSTMNFNLPDGARYMSGKFGLMAETYTGEGKTNGARFLVYWTNGTDRKDLFEQFLNPLTITEDRGLHGFQVDLSNLSGGLVILEVSPGPYNDIGWDWTGWTDIYIAR